LRARHDALVAVPGILVGLLENAMADAANYADCRADKERLIEAQDIIAVISSPPTEK